MKYIGERLRHYMKKRKLSFEALAEKAGVAKKTVELAISDPGSRSLNTLAKIARALNVSLLSLLEPAPPWEEEETLPRKEKVYVRVSEPVAQILQARAKESGVSISAYVAGILAQATRMHRVQCGECEGIFWVEQERPWKVCPYCGVREKEMLDKPIVE